MADMRVMHRAVGPWAQRVGQLLNVVLAGASPSTSGNRPIPRRCRRRCTEDRVGFGIVAGSAWRQSSSGKSACRRKATITASSSTVSTVEVGFFGPVGTSAAELRLLHFATVLRLTPQRFARALGLS